MAALRSSSPDSYATGAASASRLSQIISQQRV